MPVGSNQASATTSRSVHVTSESRFETRASRDFQRAGRCVAALRERLKGRLKDALAHRGFVAALLAAF